MRPGVSRFLRGRSGQRWVRKVEAPRFLADGGEHVEERRGGFGAVPGSRQPGGGEALLDASAVPEGGAAEDQRSDPPAVEGQRQRVPALAGGRHHLWGGQAVAPLARPAALTGAATARPCPEGRVWAQAAEYVDGGGATFQEG